MKIAAAVNDMPGSALIADIELQVDPFNGTFRFDIQAQLEGMIVAIAIIIETRVDGDIRGDEIVWVGSV